KSLMLLVIDLWIDILNFSTCSTASLAEVPGAESCVHVTSCCRANFCERIFRCHIDYRSYCIYLRRQNLQYDMQTAILNKILFEFSYGEGGSKVKSVGTQCGGEKHDSYNREEKLKHWTRLCCHCDLPMKLVKCEDRSDKYKWECRKSVNGKRNKVEISIRKGSWFEKSNMTLEEVLKFTYWWCRDQLTGIAFVEKRAKLHLWNANIQLAVLARLCRLTKANLERESIIVDIVWKKNMAEFLWRYEHKGKDLFSTFLWDLKLVLKYKKQIHIVFICIFRVYIGIRFLKNEAIRCERGNYKICHWTVNYTPLPPRNSEFNESVKNIVNIENDSQGGPGPFFKDFPRIAMVRFVFKIKDGKMHKNGKKRKRDFSWGGGCDF
ncbi:Hypothetical predicted protein, partial [Paramuricea clavata]